MALICSASLKQNNILNMFISALKGIKKLGAGGPRGAR